MFRSMLRRSRDAKQHLALRVAHLNAAILVEVLNQESGHEQLALRLGTLARRIIVGPGARKKMGRKERPSW